MLVVHVHIRVKPEFVAGFDAATIENAIGSNAEPGVVSFTLHQQADDPARFVLIEAFRDAVEAPAAHKETAHYARWRDAVAPMMAEPRSSVKYRGVYP